MIPALIIVFREGFEAFLSVAIILAYLRKTGRDSLRPAVYAGIVASIVASFALGWWLMRVNSRCWKESSVSWPRCSWPRSSSRSGGPRRR